ncbi:MAG: hypothetical protein KDE53_33965, partial [Caldilineaceae bacterium]|nr:hypothetical protein [Caldilineaceae bacterium]
WDLSRVRSLWLVDESEKRISLPFSVQQVQVEAQLVGGNRLTKVVDSDGVPLYVGAPPDLWLPRITSDLVTQEMDHWQVKLTPHWATHSRLKGEIEYQLTHWQEVIVLDNEGFTLSLAKLLGEAVLGVFTLHIRGPRNFRQEIRLRSWSELSIVDLAPYYLPSRQGAEPVQFDILLPVGQRAMSLVGEITTTITSTDSPGCFKVTVAAEASEANIELIEPHSSDDAVRLPLRLAVPRLRWLLRLDDAQAEWRTTPTGLPAARFQQSQERSLILDWIGIDAMPDCTLVLLDATNHSPNILQEVTLKPLLGSNRRHAINLSHFHDTIHYHEDIPILTLALQLAREMETPIIPLLHLKRSLDVQEVLLDWDEQGRTWLHWEASHRLRNRRVRIWSAWRPWESAREYLVPDDAPASPVADGAGGGMMALSETLPCGWYWLALCTAQLWEAQHAPSLPTEDALLSRDGDWMLRVLELHEMLETADNDAFATYFELACIYDALNRITERDEMTIWLCKYPDQGKPKQVVALRDWLQSRDTYTTSALRMRMYKAELLQRLFTEENNEEIRTAYLEDFIATKLITPQAAQLVLEH